jgi:hypothetical protein
VQITLGSRDLFRLTHQGRHGAVTRLDASVRTVYVEHTALEGFNGGNSARAHHSVNDEGALRWLNVAVEEFLDKTDIVGAIEATMTDGGHHRLHLKLLSMLRCGGDMATSAAGHGQHNVGRRSL